MEDREVLEEDELVSFRLEELQELLDKAEAKYNNLSRSLELMKLENTLFTDDELAEAARDTFIVQGKVELLQDLLGAEDE